MLGKDLHYINSFINTYIIKIPLKYEADLPCPVRGRSRAFPRIGNFPGGPGMRSILRTKSDRSHRQYQARMDTMKNNVKVTKSNILSAVEMVEE